jgi:hypothetical protein
MPQKKSKSDQLKQAGYRNNQEDMLIEHLDLKESKNRILGSLKADLYDHLENLKMKDIKGLVGKQVLLFWADRFIYHAEHEEFQKAALFADKLGPYCISKSVEKPESPGKGADMLMEVVARALGKSMDQKEIGEGVTDV